MKKLSKKVLAERIRYQTIKLNELLLLAEENNINIDIDIEKINRIGHKVLGTALYVKITQEL